MRSSDSQHEVQNRKESRPSKSQHENTLGRDINEEQKAQQHSDERHPTTCSTPHIQYRVFEITPFLCFAAPLTGVFSILFFASSSIVFSIMLFTSSASSSSAFNS
jgi:hypothetical protein